MVSPGRINYFVVVATGVLLIGYGVFELSLVHWTSARALPLRLGWILIAAVPALVGGVYLLYRAYTSDGRISFAPEHWP